MYKIFKLNNDANLLYTQYSFGVLTINFVLDLRKLCFLSKQRCHRISVHNVLYDMFGFYEFNRLCSVYSVCRQSRGYFSASVWDVFRALVFWLRYWLYCFFGLSVCLSLHIIVWIKIIIVIIITFGHRAFSVAGPTVWKSLPTEFRCLSNSFDDIGAR